MFTPFHFGGYVLEFFQDKRFFKVFGNLKQALCIEKLFIDDFCHAFRIDQLILFLGQSLVSFSPPEVLMQQLWMGIVRMHDFSQLYDVIRNLSYEERKVYWGKPIGIQKSCLEYVLEEASDCDWDLLRGEIRREIETFSSEEKERLLKSALISKKQAVFDRLLWVFGKKNVLKMINGQLEEFLYECVRCGCLTALKYFGALGMDLETERIEFEKVFRLCVHQGLVGLDMLKYLCDHSLVTFPVKEQCFMSDGQSFLAYIIVSLRDEVQILPFLVYLIETQGMSSTVSDKDKFAFTPFHWACYEGHLSLVQWFVGILKISPNFCKKGCQSAISQAGVGGHQDVLEYLEKMGGHLHLRDRDGIPFTPFHWACRIWTFISCEMVC